jgi:hypothetical protein
MHKVLGLLATLSLTLAAHGQTSTASVSGVVRDPSGGIVPGVTVTAKHDSMGQTRQAQTGAAGNYTITNLPIGGYTISASASGFKTTVISGTTLQVNQQAQIDIVLEIGSLAETVSVTEASPLLQTASTTVGQVIENRSIESLALNGRQFWQLVALTPGATYTPGGQTTNTRGTSIRATVVNVDINGSGRIYNSWLLDGADITEYQLGGTNLQPNVDALQEFKVMSADMSAEYGHGVSVINATLKSGTNEFHGTAFEFLRNDKADARFLRQSQGLLAAQPVRLYLRRADPQEQGVLFFRYGEHAAAAGHSVQRHRSERRHAAGRLQRAVGRVEIRAVEGPPLRRGFPEQHDSAKPNVTARAIFP